MFDASAYALSDVDFSECKPGNRRHGRKMTSVIAYAMLGSGRSRESRQADLDCLAEIMR